MRVMTRLCGLRELGNKKFSVPVLEHRFPLQIKRDIESLPCPSLIRCGDAIKEPYRKVGPMKPHPHSSVKDPVSSYRKVVLHTAKRPAIRKLRTSPNPQNGFATLVHLQQLVDAHDGVEKIGTGRI